VFGQKNDLLYKHSGLTLEVKILKVSEYVIVYRYPEEESEQTIGKLAVAKIKYSSGRTEYISQKIIINNQDDWKKVRILEDKTEIIGLTKSFEIKGHTNAILNAHTPNSADSKAIMKIKKEAAALKAPYILISYDNDARDWGHDVGTQGIKRGFAYTYDEPEFDISLDDNLFEDFFTLKKEFQFDKSKMIVVKRFKKSFDFDNIFKESLLKKNLKLSDGKNKENDYTLYYYIGPMMRKKGRDIKALQILIVENESGKEIIKYSSKLEYGRSEEGIKNQIEDFVESLL
jgi:hypothetical protein